MISLLSLAFLPFALAAPHNADPIHIPILRRTTTPEQRLANLPRIMDSIRIKYGYTPVNQKRSTTYSPLTDEANDSSYSAVVSIGTPAQEFNLILDTGSSDLWVATDQCTTCTSDVPLFNPSKSSSYKNGSSPLEITYGSGNVGGYISEDTVSFSGFTIANQELLAVVVTSDGLLDDELSGIMGLGFEPLSALETSPFWQTLMNQNKLSSPVFSFYLERYVNQAEMDEAPGGTFTLGGTNTSLYSGNIEFINIPSGDTPSYWFQQVQSVTVQGKSISVSSSDGLAAIDTGTTLIGAPSSIASQVWSNVPGAVAMTGQFKGMYAFPCSTSVSVSLSFGGTNWPISTADMNVGPVSGSGANEMCGGAIFDIGNTVGGSGEGVPTWIVGDTFLKNVYTVFQGNPAAVGFAQLASGSSTGTTAGSTGNPLASGAPSLGSGASPSMIVSTSLSLVLALLSGFLINL